MKQITRAIDKKAIRVSIVNQLKVEYPRFNSLKRKRKREIIRAACKEAEKAIKADMIDVPELTAEERLGLEAIPDGIMSLKAMEQFIDDHKRTVIPFKSPSRAKYIKDPLLIFMDKLLDDSLLDRLLAPEGMVPSMRTWMPSRLLRIELLRTALYPEWPVRKFCKRMDDLERKQERAFCHLPLHKLGICDHSRLSTFRSSLTVEMRVNLMVYVAHHFLSSGRVGESSIFMVDSTDVAEPINTQPLEKLEMPDGTFIRFYSDLSCDCGSRRNKRDKSKMFVGYRVHTLCITDVNSGIAFPILSLAVAANHHDSQVFDPLLSLARAVGLELKVLSVDEAYADAEKQERFVKEQGTIVVTPPERKAVVPEHVNRDDGAVYYNGACEIPMRWEGYDKEDSGHVFLCDADENECPWKSLCSGERIISMDTGLFGPIPSCVEEAQQIIDARKVTERPFNLLKHMDGLEPCRMKTQATFSTQVVFSQMVGLFKVMAGLRSVVEQKKEQAQAELPFVANG